MDAKELPPNPNLEQYKKQAKELLKGLKAGNPEACLEVRKFHPNLRNSTEAEIAGAEFRLADVQLVLARAHGFDSWPIFVKHIQAISRKNSPVSNFEMAADAVISGEISTLSKLVRQDPELVRARSSRTHRSTLLHYVSANGVEDFRQKTPRNILAVTRMLLDAGADVNAESDAYGGRSTTLGLTATSVHPEKAGVQLELMELLLEHGASIERPDGGSAVNDCLRNGRGQAAVLLASHGAQLDLEGACGIGDLQIIRGFFNDDRSLGARATRQQLLDGFAWACEFGRTEVVEFLLDHGVEVGARVKHHGQTGLHWAAANARIDTVKLLLARKAPIDAQDATWGSTPLGWALHGWGEASNASALVDYYETVSVLVAAGATVQADWLNDQKIRTERRMLAALKL